MERKHRSPSIRCHSRWRRLQQRANPVHHLFRFYRSIGGGFVRLFPRASSQRGTPCTSSLRAIGTLTPVTNPSNAAGFATALINADLGDWTTEGHAGGAYGKVIRWAFEKQGLYQPARHVRPQQQHRRAAAAWTYISKMAATANISIQPNHWSCHAIWNRSATTTAAPTHEEPIVGVTNFAYAKIKNRGTQAATNVVVRAFHANPAAGLVYPNDWQPMTTAQLSGTKCSTKQ